MAKKDERMTLRETLKAFASSLWKTIEPRFIKYETDIDIVENTNGNRTDAPQACKTGSVLYVLLNQDKHVLYVGESEVSIKSRCFGDGSGAHNRKPWFSEVKYVRYYKPREGEMTKAERVLVEQALILILKPSHNDTD